HRQRWDAPGVVAIRSAPPGSDVELERYELQSDGARTAVLQPSPGRTPVTGLELPAGSYRVTFRLPGRALVRYPFVLSRDERLAIDLSLPESAHVPAGYVYIPPGRFLFGSPADDDLRRNWLHAAPIHAAQTGAYLIGKDEVTFAQWIEYLNALPIQ